MRRPTVLLMLCLVAPSAVAQTRRPDAGPTTTPRADAGSRPAIAPRADAGAPPPGPPVCALPAVGVAVTAPQVAAAMQAFYDRTNDFEADFEQVSRNRLAGRDEVRRGHVRFLKPGRMRWDYAAPAGDVVVSDGSTLWAYEAAARQAIQSGLTQSQLPSALSFLTGVGQLTTTFSFRLLDSARFQYPSGLVLEGTPLQANPSYARIVFFVDRASCQVTRTAVFDAQGNSNRFTFTNVRVNTAPAQSVFQWRPPAGTQIVRP